MRLRTLILFGAGYVLGSRAGREPYEEFVARIRTFLDSDLVRDHMGNGAVRQPADGVADQGDRPTV